MSEYGFTSKTDRHSFNGLFPRKTLVNQHQKS